MKKYFTIIILFIVCLGFSQEKEKQNSKMDDFVSKTGVIIKYEDFNLPNIKLYLGVAKSKIRKISSGKESQLFLQISKEDKYGDKTASIAYDDLLEMQKALISLSLQSEKDVITNSDYLENKFVTDDGFQVGYYVSKGKISWYLKLAKYGSNNTVFSKDLKAFETAFQLGKEKIESLKL